MWGRSKVLVAAVWFVLTYFVAFLLESRVNVMIAAVMVVLSRGAMFSRWTTQRVERMLGRDAVPKGGGALHGDSSSLDDGHFVVPSWETAMSALWRARRRLWWVYLGVVPVVVAGAWFGRRVDSVVVSLAIFEIWLLLGYRLGAQEASSPDLSSAAATLPFSR